MLTNYLFFFVHVNFTYPKIFDVLVSLIPGYLDEIVLLEKVIIRSFLDYCENDSSRNFGGCDS
jgi:hypothetical protein